MADSATTNPESREVPVYSSSQVSTAGPETPDSATVQTAAQSGVTNLGSAIGNIAGQAQSAISNLGSKIAGFLDLGNISKAIRGLASIVQLPGSPPFPNVLHSYASYNYIFTLSVLDDFSINFPVETYKSGLLGQIILKSGSGDPNNRVPITDGKFDFFIDNLSIFGAIGIDNVSGNTNAHTIRFKVIEPYSMGLFFESVQTAAKNAGYENWVDIPLLLTIDFVGHLNPAEQGINADSLSIENTTKHIPMKLMTIDMKVTHRGAEYDIAAYPWNEEANSTTHAELKTDLAVSGKTVHEMLQTGTNSLQRVLNDRLKAAAEREERDRDHILISFPSDIATLPAVETSDSEDDTASTVDPIAGGTGDPSIERKLGVTLSSENGTLVQSTSSISKIGLASMGFNYYRPGDPPFAKDNAVYDEKTNTYTRGNITINPNEGQLKFAQGNDIINVINQTILLSDYSRQALSADEVSDTGKLPWWKIETQVYNIPGEKNLSKTGIPPKLIVYRVVPYGVNVSKALPPNATNPKIEELKKQIIKKYDYIYTSQNLDILSFDIEFKAAFYQALAADGGSNTASTVTAAKTGKVSDGKQDQLGTPAEGSKPTDKAVPDKRKSVAITQSSSKQGGTSRDTPQTTAARQFFDILKDGADMIKANIVILGDPYFIGDSGLGNYSAKKSNFENMNADYSMDYQSGEVNIEINFRTPVDIDVSQGAYTFGNTKALRTFSGVWQVLEVENNFSRGKFTQTLKCVRQMGQDDTGAGPSDEVASDAVGAPVSPEVKISQSADNVVSPDGFIPFTEDPETGRNVEAGG